MSETVGYITALGDSLSWWSAAICSYRRRKNEAPLHPAGPWSPRSNQKLPAVVQRKLLKAVREFGTYITANRPFIPNYGDRYRHGETISTAFVESAINQAVSKRMVKKQQMRWTDRAAHLLLQVRTRVLNEEWHSTLSH